MDSNIIRYVALVGMFSRYPSLHVKNLYSFAVESFNKGYLSPYFINRPSEMDDDGVAHDWRAELRAELARTQQPDGSWINSNERWLEGDPNLVTGYALLTLSCCKPGEPGE